MGLDKQTNYCSFLLRMWQVKENGSREWRASLENVENGERHIFTSLKDLLAYFLQLATTSDDTSSEGNQGELQG